MVTEYYSIKQSDYSIHDFINFKQVAMAFSSRIHHLETGKSKTMFYIKTIGRESTWKQLLNNNIGKFQYLPNGVSNKDIKWHTLSIGNGV